MPEIVRTPWRTLGIGDYVRDKDGTVWKVVRHVLKEDGRYLGIEDKDGHQHIISPRVQHNEVDQVLYGAPSVEDAVEAVRSTLGAQLLATEKYGRWVHPGWDEIEADADLLRAHLVRFHEGEQPSGGMRLAEVAEYHRRLHDPGVVPEADHTHESRTVS